MEFSPWPRALKYDVTAPSDRRSRYGVLDREEGHPTPFRILAEVAEPQP